MNGTRRLFMKEHILITGVGGMIGSHMTEYFFEQRIPVVGTYYNPTTNIGDIREKAVLYECDIRYFLNIYRIIDKYRPIEIYHLAAQSYPSVSWNKPQETIEINMTGTVNVFEAIRMVQEEDPEYNPVVVVACSSAEYGASLETIKAPVSEDTPLLPLHPYGVSKVGQDLLAYQYYVNFGIRCIRARIFNTTGPRKANDVCADFVKRIVGMEKSGTDNPILRVGNLETKRAITDVRDLVSALVLLGRNGKPGEAYNISGKNVYEIKQIVEILGKYTNLREVRIEVDPALLRPTDEAVICGDSSKLVTDTGWKQSYDLESTLKDMLEYERDRQGVES